MTGLHEFSEPDELTQQDFSFILQEDISGIAALSIDFVVLRRVGRLSRWLPEIGHSCFESDLLCGLEDDLRAQQHVSTNETLTLPEMRVMLGEMAEKISIVILWDAVRQIYVVLTTRDQLARPIDEWMQRRVREQRILEEQIAVANREIAIREMRYQDVVENNPDLICRYDADFVVTFANPALAEFLDRPNVQILGAQLGALFILGEGNAFWKGGEAWADGTNELVQVQAKAGDWRWIMWSARMIDGEIHEFQAVGRDVTNLKALEATISRQRDALEQTNRELKLSNTHLNQFSAVAAHDLQAPLRQAAAFAGLLHTRHAVALDSEAVEFIKLMTDSLKRMQKMVASLLNYARLSANAYKWSQVNMNDVVTAARANLAGEIASAGAVLETGALPQIQGDSTLLIQLLQNLLANSLQYRSNSPLTISVVGELRGNWVEFSVTDSGRGLKPEDAGAIFEMFCRAESAHGTDGTGIGLSLCKRIVEIHGGNIWLDPHFSDGFRVVFTLPAGGPS